MNEKSKHLDGGSGIEYDERGQIYLDKHPVMNMKVIK